MCGEKHNVADRIGPQLRQIGAGKGAHAGRRCVEAPRPIRWNAYGVRVAVGEVDAPPGRSRADPGARNAGQGGP